MLSLEQKMKMATILNSRINIPFLPERIELPIFVQAVETITSALDENLPDEMRRLLNEVEQGIDVEHLPELLENLVKFINKKVDLPLMNERQEAEVIRMVAEIMLESMKKNTTLDNLLSEKQ